MKYENLELKTLGGKKVPSNIEVDENFSYGYPKVHDYITAFNRAMENFEKSLAGDKAKEILKNGGCIEDAKSVL